MSDAPPQRRAQGARPRSRRARSSARSRSGADDEGELRQRDTYFAAPRGRLKLREQEPGRRRADRLRAPRRRRPRARATTASSPVADADGAARGARRRARHASSSSTSAAGCCSGRACASTSTRSTASARSSSSRPSPTPASDLGARARAGRAADRRARRSATRDRGPLRRPARRDARTTAPVLLRRRRARDAQRPRAVLAASRSAPRCARRRRRPRRRQRRERRLPAGPVRRGVGDRRAGRRRASARSPRSPSSPSSSTSARRAAAAASGCASSPGPTRRCTSGARAGRCRRRPSASCCRWRSTRARWGERARPPPRSCARARRAARGHRARLRARRGGRRRRGRHAHPLRRPARLPAPDRRRPRRPRRAGALAACRSCVLRAARTSTRAATRRRRVTPVRALRAAGAEILVLTNAAGSLRPEVGPGSLMAISDHINLTGHNPLVGPNDEAIGPRFPSLRDAYDPALRAELHAAARDARHRRSPRASTSRSAARASRRRPRSAPSARLGADAVGMSTVHETIVARHAGLRVAAVSAISNLAEGLSDVPLSHEQTLADAAARGRRPRAADRGVRREARMMLVQEVLRAKRDGRALTDDEIAFLVAGIADGSLSDAQVGALAMAIVVNGMSARGARRADRRDDALRRGAARGTSTVPWSTSTRPAASATRCGCCWRRCSPPAAPPCR